MISKVWLADIPWEMVAWQNEQLCKAKNAHHGPTSDGYDVCRALWQESQMQEVPLVEIVELCRKCHRMAPFTNCEKGLALFTRMNGASDSVTQLQISCPKDSFRL